MCLLSTSHARSEVSDRIVNLKIVTFPAKIISRVSPMVQATWWWQRHSSRLKSSKKWWGSKILHHLKKFWILSKMPFATVSFKQHQSIFATSLSRTRWTNMICYLKTISSRTIKTTVGIKRREISRTSLKFKIRKTRWWAIKVLKKLSESIMTTPTDLRKIKNQIQATMKRIEMRWSRQ